MTQALTKVDQQGVAEYRGMPTPREIIAAATEQANALMEIVEKRKLYQNFGGKKFMQVEAWEMIGRFNNSLPSVEWSKAVEENGQIIGYHSRVNLMKDGIIEASAEAMAFLDESIAASRKNNNSKKQAAMSMSQTRATSKAYRLAYSFVAVLAGFEATPAEEMEPDDRPAPRQQQRERPTSSQQIVDVAPQQVDETPALTPDERLARLLERAGRTQEQADSWFNQNYGGPWGHMTELTKASALMGLTEAMKAAAEEKARQQAESRMAAFTEA